MSEKLIGEMADVDFSQMIESFIDRPTNLDDETPAELVFAVVDQREKSIFIQNEELVMSTLVIELPEAVASEAQSSGISTQQLEAVVLRFVQKYVQEDPRIELERILNDDEGMVQQMADAATDPLFMADLQETMTAFAIVDTEWWEPVA
ncbi:MAG: hypothetical protein DYG89_32580 [Caldilinea sp. CFX5]|nr:hypothetical protein [Caldilinea sp. CFX5]